jgi:hypothetical protein
MATAAILNFFQLPQKLPHTMVDIPTKFHDSDFFLAYLVDETFQKFCLTCVHIILRLRNFRMAAIATKKREQFKVLGIG